MRSRTDSKVDSVCSAGPYANHSIQVQEGQDDQSAPIPQQTRTSLSLSTLVVNSYLCLCSLLTHMHTCTLGPLLQIPPPWNICHTQEGLFYPRSTLLAELNAEVRFSQRSAFCMETLPLLASDCQPIQTESGLSAGGVAHTAGGNGGERKHSSGTAIRLHPKKVRCQVRCFCPERRKPDIGELALKVGCNKGSLYQYDITYRPYDNADEGVNESTVLILPLSLLSTLLLFRDELRTTGATGTSSSPHQSELRTHPIKEASLPSPCSLAAHSELPASSSSSPDCCFCQLEAPKKALPLFLAWVQLFEACLFPLNSWTDHTSRQLPPASSKLFRLF
ncbi:hypothetical protein WMY93_027897 [Mugilogobius chulae]|uniref:Uncharacterized protein n=1 Tax=Mugilogobius chulae TaxID=88201 RepID=A0AAW0N111_9GOBI